MHYYYRYFELDLSICTFAIIFLIRRTVKVVRKRVNDDKYFDTEGVCKK
jgi:hypothetical protein